MKIISHELGKATRWFVPDEIRPVGGLNVPELIRLVSERYAFGAVPTLTDTEKNGAVFKQGRMITGSKKLHIPTLAIFVDSVMVSAYDTDTAEEVLRDVLTWGFETFSLRKPVTPSRDVFESQIVVEFDSAAEKALKAFDGMKKRYEAALSETYQLKLPVGLSRIAIGPDPMAITWLRPPEFGIERRQGRPHSANRFFCFAPLRTKVHEELLVAFEKMAMT